MQFQKHYVINVITQLYIGLILRFENLSAISEYQKQEVVFNLLDSVSMFCRLTHYLNRVQSLVLGTRSSVFTMQTLVLSTLTQVNFARACSCSRLQRFFNTVDY